MSATPSTAAAKWCPFEGGKSNLRGKRATRNGASDSTEIGYYCRRPVPFGSAVAHLIYGTTGESAPYLSTLQLLDIPRRIQYESSAT